MHWNVLLQHTAPAPTCHVIQAQARSRAYQAPLPWGDSRASAAAHQPQLVAGTGVPESVSSPIGVQEQPRLRCSAQHQP